jgi:S-DNA-T family DNA segregation ATPase FtsK/SpoIIIE
VGSFGKLVALESIKYLGLFAYLFPLLLLYPLYKLYKDPKLDIRSAERVTAGLLLLVSVLIFEAMVFSFPFDSYFGVSITRFLEPFIGAVGIWLFWFMLVLMGIFIYFDLDFEDVKEMLNGKFDAFKKQKQEERELAESEEEIKAIIKNELTKKDSENIEKLYTQESKDERVVIQEDVDELKESVHENESSDEIAIKMYEVREEDEEKYASMVRLIDSTDIEEKKDDTQIKEPESAPVHKPEPEQPPEVEEKAEVESLLEPKMEPVPQEESQPEPEPLPESQPDSTPIDTTPTQIRQPLTHESKIVKELEENKELLNSIEQGDRDKPKDFQLPHMEFLKEAPSKAVQIDESEIDEKIEDLLDKLQRFKIEGDVVRTYSGPIVTTFEFRPAPNVKVSKILNLEDDLAMALKAKTIRIQAPVPGKDVVGIEIPNKEFDTIYLRDVLESELFEKAASPLTIALGKDIVGNPFITDLKKLPHLLIAGTTGSGKSVGINAMILSLLYRNSPDDLKFLMIDPKMLEFSIYNDIPHLLTPVITQPKQAVTALNNMVAEMERRYTLMSTSRTKNIENYNKKISENGGEELPYIVVIIDELADLMMTSGKDVEHSIGRLAQMARASGIHLIVATQRPSVDVVTGLIKANLPSRISFRVGQKIDSKVILDGFGAESLLGRGDMLFTPPGMVGLVRLHAPWVSEPEIEEIVDFLKSQREPEYNEDFLRKESTISKNNEILGTPNDVDELFEEAKEIVMTDKKTSISYLQRKLQIGYNRSATLVEQLEAAGVLSAPNAKGNREVLI